MKLNNSMTLGYLAATCRVLGKFGNLWLFPMKSIQFQLI